MYSLTIQVQTPTLELPSQPSQTLPTPILYTKVAKKGKTGKLYSKCSLYFHLNVVMSISRSTDIIFSHLIFPLLHAYAAGGCQGGQVSAACVGDFFYRLFSLMMKIEKKLLTTTKILFTILKGMRKKLKTTKIHKNQHKIINFIRRVTALSVVGSELVGELSG